MFCPACPTKSVFTCQPTAILVSTTVKTAKPALKPNSPYTEEKTDNNLIWWRRYTLCCMKDQATPKKKNYLHFWSSFFSNQTQAHPSLCHQGRGSFPLCHQCQLPHWLIQLTKESFAFSLYKLSVYSKATRFSQSPTTVLSGLSTSNQIQSLWL